MFTIDAVCVRHIKNKSEYNNNIYEFIQHATETLIHIEWEIYRALKLIQPKSMYLLIVQTTES